MYHKQNQRLLRSRKFYIKFIVFILTFINLIEYSFSQEIFEKKLSYIINNPGNSYKLEIKKSQQVFISWRFYFSDSEERALASHEIGSAYTTCSRHNSCGQPFELYFAVKDKNNSVAASGNVTANGRDHFTSNYFSRPICDLYLKKGDYYLEISVKGAFLRTSLDNIALNISDEGRVKSN